MLLCVCLNIWLFINVDKHIADTNYDKMFFSHENNFFY